jgi:hypothetical protein
MQQHPGIVGEIQSFHPHMNAFPPPSLEPVTDREIDRVANLTLLNSCARVAPLDPVVGFVDHTDQPPVMVDALLQGVRPQLQLHGLVVKSQQKEMEATAAEAMQRAADFYVGRAERGYLPIDPAQLESRTNAVLPKLQVLPPRERAISLHEGGYSSRQLDVSGLARRDGVTLLSVEDFLMPSGAINYPMVAHVAAHELGHQVGGRASIVDERGCRTLISGVGSRYFDANNQLVETRKAEEPVVEDMATPASAQIAELPEDDMANAYTAYEGAWDIDALRPRRPAQYYWGVMPGFFANGADGDIDRLLDQKRRSLNIVRSVCEIPK